MLTVENKSTIYIAEDEPSIRRLYQAAFSAYRTRVFPDGESTLDAIKLNPREVNLLVTDRNLPVMKGDELIEECQKIWCTQRPPRRVPVIMVTASSLDFDPTDSAFRKHAEKIGIDEILLKPFHLNELLRVVTQYLPD